MKRKLLRFYFSLIVVLSVGLINTTAQELKHSYVFEEGAVTDVVGGTSGTLVGDATIVEGELVLSGDGYVKLPAKTIDIPSYSSVTIESVFTQAAGLTGFTMLYSFGATQDVGWPMGVDYLMYQPTRGDAASYYSRAALVTGDYGSPWNTENGVNGDMITDTIMHYSVVVVTATELSYYLDGKLVGITTLSGTNALASVSNDTAYIGASVYFNDAKWQGAISEFNIYEGAMTESDVAQRTVEVFGPGFSDPSLQSLTFDVGELSPAFDATASDYELMVPYGVTNVQVSAIPVVPQATVTIYDANTGSEFPGGAVSYEGDGIDLEIEVVAMDGQTETFYYVSIYLDPIAESAELTDIMLSVGSLVGAFDSKTTSYTAKVPYGTTSVDVTGVPVSEEAKVEGGGSIAIVDGAAEVELLVTSADGSNTKTYTVSVYESDFAVDNYYYIQHEDGGMVVGESGEGYNVVKLYQPFLNAGNQLFRFVESGKEGEYFIQNQDGNYMTLSPANVSTWDMLMTEELTADLDSCRFEVEEFEQGRFHIISVARQNSFENVYMGPNASGEGNWVYSDKWADNNLITWNIKFPADIVDPYDTYLSTLEVSAGSMRPAFSSMVKEYYVTLPIGTTAFDVTALANDAGSSVDAPTTVTLDGDTGSVTIVVTAVDPAYSSVYTIHYNTEVELAMMHSYTFANGTAMDMVGDAHGTIHGGSINEGVYTASELGDYIDLPAEEIAINTYPSFTLELFVADNVESVNESVNTMIASFGESIEGWKGINYFMVKASSRTAISCLETGSPWGTETGVDGASLDDDGAAHHIVSVINSDSVTFYLDGMLVGVSQLSDNNQIYNISNATAYLCRSSYDSDNTWLGSIYEYNIYAGVMDAQTVSLRYQAFPIDEISNDATLSEIFISDTTFTAFSSSELKYSIVVPEGITEVPDITVTPTNANAKVVVEKAASIPGVTTITVTSECEKYQVVYTFEFSGVTAVGNAGMIKTMVYPTVTSGAFMVESEKGSQTISVYDVSGNRVMQKFMNSAYEEINLQKAGVYILVVENENNRNVFKIIKTN